MTEADTAETQRCPRCAATAIVQLRGEAPWCGACEWNLAQWPAPKQKRGSKRKLLDRRRAFELNERLMREFGGVLPAKPRPTRADDVLTAASVVLLVVDLMLLVGGVYLLITGNWFLKAVGVFVVLVGIECRPRFPRADEGAELSRADYPNMWAVVDAAAQAVGAPRIDRLTVSNEFDASCGREGIRGAVSLDLGLPLWAALGPAGRHALLGHELGHLVNGDPARRFWTQSTLTTFARLAHVFDPHALDDSAPTGYHANLDPRNAISMTLAAGLAYVLFSPIHLLFAATQRALWRVAAEEHQRAELYADAIGARLGGTSGAVELAYVHLSPGLVNRGLIRGAEASADPETWRDAVAASLEQTWPERRLAEQRSLRDDAWRFATHPPAGLRSRLASSWPPTPPSAADPRFAMAAADRELHRQYKSAQRAILNRSVF